MEVMTRPVFGLALCGGGAFAHDAQEQAEQLRSLLVRERRERAAQNFIGNRLGRRQGAGARWGQPVFDPAAAAWPALDEALRFEPVGQAAKGLDGLKRGHRQRVGRGARCALDTAEVARLSKLSCAWPRVRR